MGGRGSSSGMSVKGLPYGTEFKSLLTYGNIKFVVYKGGETKSPMETMTKRRVYVTLDQQGEPAYITYHDASNKRTKQIDLQHEHQHMQPYTHHGYYHNENDTKKGAARPTAKEKKLVQLVNKIWKERKKRVWTRWQARH